MVGRGDVRIELLPHFFYLSQFPRIDALARGGAVTRFNEPIDGGVDARMFLWKRSGNALIVLLCVRFDRSNDRSS